MTRAWIPASAALGLLCGLAPCSPEDFGLWPVLILGLAAGQSALLREVVPAWRWGLVTIGGLVLGVPLGYAAAIAAFGGLAAVVQPANDEGFGGILVAGVVVGAGAIGLVLGLLQAKVGARDRRAGPWMIASACGVIVASPLFLVVTCTDVIVLGGVSFSRPLLTALCGLGYGLSTAIALPRLSRAVP